MPTLIPTADKGARSEPAGLTHVDPAQLLLPTEKEAFLADTGLNGPFVADLLSDMTAHERGGVALYRSVGGRTHNPVLKQRYEHFEHQTVEHVDVLETLVARLGGDPGYVSPSARATERAGLSLIESTFLLGGSIDLMTQELVMLDAVLLAEAKDHANWAGLVGARDRLPRGRAAERRAGGRRPGRARGGRAPRLGAGHADQADQRPGEERGDADHDGQGRGDGGPDPGAVLVSPGSPLDNPEVPEADALDQETEVDPDADRRRAEPRPRGARGRRPRAEPPGSAARLTSRALDAIA